MTLFSVRSWRVWSRMRPRTKPILPWLRDWIQDHDFENEEQGQDPICLFLIPLKRGSIFQLHIPQGNGTDSLSFNIALKHLGSSVLLPQLSSNLSEQCSACTGLRHCLWKTLAVPPAAMAIAILPRHNWPAPHHCLTANDWFFKDSDCSAF